MADWIREILRYKYGEAQITKDKFWNVNGTMTNKLKQDPSWSFNHSSSNVDRIGCCADTSKNYHLGNMLPKHIGSIAAKDQLTSKQNRKKPKKSRLLEANQRIILVTKPYEGPKTPTKHPGGHFLQKPTN